MISGKDHLKEMKEYIRCPQFGDDHYGKYGALRLEQRKEIKRLIDYCDYLEDFEYQVEEFLIKKMFIQRGSVWCKKNIGTISKSDFNFFFKNLLDIDELVVYDDSTD